MISTRGRYSVRIILDLAQNRNGGYIPLKDVAARQDISFKYLERLMPELRNAGLVESVHGIGGGYRLTKEPEDYTVWEILRCSEGELVPVACMQQGGSCDRVSSCCTLPMWQGYYDMTKSYFSGITIADLMNRREYDYVI